MQGWQAGATAMAVAMAVVSMGVLLARRQRLDAELLFAAVSGSMALSLLSPWLAAGPGTGLAPLQWAVAVGGSFTCNGYWLVSRALFRGPGGVGRVHVAVAAGVALLIAAYRGSTLGASGVPSPWVYGLDSVLTLASSTLLVLSFLEALRGWSPALAPAERRMRAGFMVVFAGCVLSVTLVSALAPAWPGLGPVRGGLVAACAMAMIGFTHFALRHRRRVPLPAAAERAGSRPVAPTGAEDARLLQALLHQLDVLQVYREPDLKVADLARRLCTTEHRLSRVVTGPLGERNFNRMLNRRRIADACRRLSDPDCTASVLEISGDCGFASPGPFNRAFKEETGCTPTAYRASCQAAAPAVQGTQASAGPVQAGMAR